MHLHLDSRAPGIHIFLHFFTYYTNFLLVFNNCVMKDGDNKNKDNTETTTAWNREGQEKGNEALGKFFYYILC